MLVASSPTAIVEDGGERYLRPRDLQERNLESSWSDSQHKWMADPTHGFILVKVLQHPSDGVTEVELPDRTVITIDQIMRPFISW